MLTNLDLNKNKNKINIENKLVVGKGEIDMGMGEIGEGDWEDTYCDEHWLMYRIVETLYCTSETNTALCTVC